MGVNITDEEIIDSSSLHDKKKVKDRIAAQSKQAAEQAQQQMQMAMQQQQVITDAAESKALSDRSLAAERTAKIQLDQALNAERLSRAEEDRTAGVLNLIKAVKELEGMDIEALAKKIEILRSLEISQEVKEQTTATESMPTPQQPAA